jgi:hypothetical protein
MFWRPKREREMYFFLRCRGRGAGVVGAAAVVGAGTVGAVAVGVGGERSLRPEEEEEWGPEVWQMMIGEEVARESAEDDGSCILIFFVN